MKNYIVCLGSRHVFAKPPECHILASYQMRFCQKLLKNAKNLEMGNLGATRCGFHKNSQIFTIVGFGVFEQFLAKLHLVARQNRTIWTFGWCMSALNPNFPNIEFLLQKPNFGKTELEPEHVRFIPKTPT